MGGEWSDEKTSQIRRITAKRLLESKTTIPHYYLTVECTVDRLMALRGQLNARLAADGKKLSVNDFIVKASALVRLLVCRLRVCSRSATCSCCMHQVPLHELCSKSGLSARCRQHAERSAWPDSWAPAQAMRKVPEANASWHGDFIRQYHNVDISVAVQTPAGLQVAALDRSAAPPERRAWLCSGWPEQWWPRQASLLPGWRFEPACWHGCTLADRPAHGAGAGAEGS